VAQFPQARMRRLRRTETLRRMIRETTVRLDDLVYPLFVVPGLKKKQAIESMPGIHRLSADLLAKEAEEIFSLGIPAVILFGLPEKKDEIGSQAYTSDSIIQKAIVSIKKAVPDLLVITDICLCQYTTHGHCGVIENSQIVNDKSLESISRMALSHAEAGADIVAPSDMMDGRVAAIRTILDTNGFQDIIIMSYAVKYASAFYGPFRDAADSSPQFGDRRSYQMDPANAQEALREIELDINEGADIVMVKPALAYLDVIRNVRNKYNIPLAAFNVSGEYSMIKAAVTKGWLDEQQTVLEILTSIKRAGASLILTYHAKEAARWLQYT